MAFLAALDLRPGRVRRRRPGTLSALRHLGHVHEKRLPDVSVRVFKTTAIHEALILFRIDVDLTTVRSGSVHHRIDGLPGIAGNRQHGFARVSRVGDRLLGEK